MTYVWIHESAGLSRFVNDIYLPPCNQCGERVSVCRANDCLGEEEPTECSLCNAVHCACDNIYETHRDNQLD